MKRLLPALSFLAALSMHAAAADLLTQPPPCPAPADLPAGGNAELDPRAETASGIPPADINGPSSVNLDIPIYLPQGTVNAGSNSTRREIDGVAQSGDSPNTGGTIPPQLDVPIGGVAIRDNKAVSMQVFGQEQLPQNASTLPSPCRTH